MNSSDNVTRVADVSFAHAGTGLPCTFRCARCHGAFGNLTGCGIRRVLGLRQRVCSECKVVIDKSRLGCKP